MSISQGNRFKRARHMNPIPNVTPSILGNSKRSIAKKISKGSRESVSRSSRRKGDQGNLDGTRKKRGARRKRNEEGARYRILETHHSVDAPILCQGLIETADRSQEDNMAIIEERDPGSCCVPTDRGGSCAKVKGREGCTVIAIRPSPSSENRSATNRVGSGNLPTEVVRGKQEAGKR